MLIEKLCIISNNLSGLFNIIGIDTNIVDEIGELNHSLFQNYMFVTFQLQPMNMEHMREVVLEAM